MSANKLASKLKLNFNSSLKKELDSPKASDKCKPTDRNRPLMELAVNTTRQQDHLGIGPVSSFASGDIEWQWSSPPPPVSTVKGTVEKTPLQHMKMQYKSISPISDNFPRKRKLIRSEVPEPPVIITKEAADMNASEARQDYSTLLDDEDAMDNCLLQCSQFVEASLSQNPLGIEPLQATTPRSTRLHTALPNKTSVHLSHQDDTSQDVPSNKMIPKLCVENKMCEDSETRCDIQCSLTPVCNVGGEDSGTNNKNLNQGQNSSLQAMDVNKTVPTKVLNACSVTNTYEINDSYDDLLMTFCDENFELLSQPLPKKNNNEDKVQQQCVSSETSLDKMSETRGSQHDPAATVEGVVATNLDTLFSEGTLDDDFLQPDLLKVLETVERTTTYCELRAASPVHCTPEEIEKKRLQAKIKLERKKSANFNEINRLSYTGVVKR